MHRLLFFLLALLSLQQVSAASVADVSKYSELAHRSNAELMDMGRRYFATHQTDSAVICFTLLANQYSEDLPIDEQELIARAINNLGCTYQYFYFDYSLAYLTFMRALDIAKFIGSPHVQAIVMFNLCELQRHFYLCYIGRELPGELRQRYQDCLEMARRNKDMDLYLATFSCYTYYDKQVDLTKYQDILGTEIPDTVVGLHYARCNYHAMEAMQRKDYSLARQWFQQQLAAIDNPWMPEISTLTTYLDIAETYHLEHNTPEAIRQLETAREIAREKGVVDMEILVLQQLAAYSGEMGQNEQHTRYRMAYLEKRDSMQQLNSLQDIQQVSLIYELEKEGREMDQLAARHRQQQRLLLSISAGLLLILLVAMLLWRLNRKLWNRNKSLYDQIHLVMKAEANERQLRNTYEQQLQTMATTYDETPKYNKSNLNEQDSQRLLRDIQNCMNSAEIICQTDFTLTKLAKHLSSNTTYVSQVINEHYNMSFSNLLGSYRVREACRRMDHVAEYGNKTIEAIAESVGFRSRVAFTKAFKRETGMSPSDYFRMAKSNLQP